MNRIEHYHDRLRDAHAMEEQVESMLESMVSRIDNYLELRACTEQRLSEAKDQIAQLETALDRNDISRSVVKDFMNKIAALRQSIGDILLFDEIVKGSISGYVFGQLEIVCYTSFLAAAKNAGDTTSIPTIEVILNDEKHMADWLIQHIPQTAERSLIRSETDGVGARK